MNFGTCAIQYTVYAIHLTLSRTDLSLFQVFAKKLRTVFATPWRAGLPGSHVTPYAVDQPSFVLCFRCVSVNIIVLEVVCGIHCENNRENYAMHVNPGQLSDVTALLSRHSK